MFVSVIVEPGGLDSAKALAEILTQRGFTKIQKACWENSRMNENDLSSLKADIDKVTDYYDKIRLYQFPLENALVVTELDKKKWRRCVLKGTASTAAPATQPVKKTIKKN